MTLLNNKTKDARFLKAQNFFRARGIILVRGMSDDKMKSRATMRKKLMKSSTKQGFAYSTRFGESNAKEAGYISFDYGNDTRITDSTWGYARIGRLIVSGFEYGGLKVEWSGKSTETIKVFI